MKAILAVLALYVTAALVFVPLAGVHTDEAIFASALYRPREATFLFEAGPVAIPLLLISYLGTLKAGLYWLILKVFAPTVWTIRAPMVLAAAGAIGLLWATLRRAGQPVAAVAAAAVLASDSVFLLTTTYDWGPVALQQLLIAGGVYCVARRATGGGNGWMAAGGALFGLALWNKALAAWMIGGLALGTAVVLPRAAWGLRWRAWALFAAGAVVGAGPILAYNLSRPLGTYRENARWATTEDMMNKPRYLWDTLRGIRLRGFLLYPGSPEEQRNESLAAPAAALALAAVVLFRDKRRRRMGVFVGVAAAGAAIPMFLLANAGMAVHHTVLVWPLPHVMVALGIAELADGARWRRWAAGAAGAAIVASNAAVLAEHYRDFRQYGFASVWSDAVFPLAEMATASGASNVFANDWGIQDNLELLTGGRYLFDSGTGWGWPAAPEEISDHTVQAKLDERGLYVQYVPELAIFPQAEEKIRTVAGSRGLNERTVREVKDSRGRPIFRVTEFIPDQNQSK